MIFVILLLGLIAFFDLRRLYKDCSKGQAVVVTLLFAAVLAVCALTAAGVQLKSPIVVMGDMMKNIGLSYPPLQ